MKKHATIYADLLIAIAFAVVTFSLWGAFNRPASEPPWPQRIMGFSFSPMHEDQDGIARIYPTEAQLDADLALLAGKTHAVRTYTVDGTLSLIPALAARHDINVALGVWIGDSPQRVREEIDLAKTLAQSHRNILRILVGNEVILRGDFPEETLYAYLDEVRASVWQPVSTPTKIRGLKRFSMVTILQSGDMALLTATLITSSAYTPAEVMERFFFE